MFFQNCGVSELMCLRLWYCSWIKETNLTHSRCHKMTRSAPVGALFLPV